MVPQNAIQLKPGKSLPGIVYSAIAFFAILSLLSACENSEEEIRERTRRRMGVDEARNVETYFSQAGKVKAKLTSVLMLRYQDSRDTPRVEFPEKLHVDFYNDSLEVESVLDALYGRYIEGQNKMYLRDSVVVVQQFNQDTLRCEELWWDQNKGKFYSDKPIRITKKDGTVMPGKGLVASQDFKNIEILNPEDGLMYLDEAGFPGSTVAPDSSAGAQPDSLKTPSPPDKP
ncbi:MAG: LPS export ABC transporter periplasmic protein LptC [Chitinophagaceae bacterium]|nr:LPS export ABC transporter periplasmic protein LptC [Chitinophagaceae bacterium]